MRLATVMLACALAGASLASAAERSAPDNPDTINVNAVRDPEVRKYTSILAGLDTFDRHRHLAPGVDALRFRVQLPRDRGSDAAVRVRLEGDGGFVLPISPDARGDYVVPRSDEAKAANSELVLNQKSMHYRIQPHVRTPGLPANVRRLGDLRLECKVWVAISKEEIGLMWTLTINGLLRTRDWCTFLDKGKAGYAFHVQQRLVRAILHEGNRSALLESRRHSFMAPLHDTSWGDEALVELEFDTPAAAPIEELTGTAGETPRTGP